MVQLNQNTPHIASAPLAPGEISLAEQGGLNGVPDDSSLSANSTLRSIAPDASLPVVERQREGTMTTLRKLVAPNPCSMKNIANVPVGVGLQMARVAAFTAVGSMWMNGMDAKVAGELVLQGVAGASVLAPFIAMGVELGLGRVSDALMSSALDVRYLQPLADPAFMLLGGELLARAGLKEPPSYKYENESFQDPSDLSVGFNDDGTFEITLKERNAEVFDTLREATTPLRGAAVFGMTLAIIGFSYMCYDACKDDAKAGQTSDEASPASGERTAPMNSPVQEPTLDAVPEIEMIRV